jgi:predicted nuclease of predicted toxin-antitoxin system
LKLLLDQNLPARLLVRLDPHFPGSTQARRIGLERASDTDLWHYARIHDFAIVSKDSDFYERGLLFGFPPQVIWLKCGNVSTRQLEEILMRSREAITTFLQERKAACLEIY